MVPQDGPGGVAAPSEEALRAWLVGNVARQCGVQESEVDSRQPFTSYGLGSRDAVALSGQLEAWLQRELSPTLAWEYPTIDQLARHLAHTVSDTAAPRVGRVSRAPEPIAIVGIGCRFPGAAGRGEFWTLLRDGVDAITEVPSDRWNADEFYDPDPAAAGKMNSRWGGFLNGIDRFDADFFGIAPREAVGIDPQQRMVLEVVWEALEDAGQPPTDLAGSDTGVFIGVSTYDYGRLLLGDTSHIDAYAGTGGALSIVANRVSYALDLRGPSVVIDTACSSSLVAVHLACRSIRAGDCTVAIAGGVNLILSPTISINFSKAGVMAADGRCKFLDARADGYVRGEGAGIVVLKPVSRAVADCDVIHALILGSAVNQNGRSNGLMAPNQLAQEDVLRAAYRDAGVSPGTVQFVEAHGTGTALGDVIEAAALGRVLGEGRPAGERCLVASAKTNIGHLEAAAGVAGLIKTALALKRRTVPPSLHFEEPNPLVPFETLPIAVVTRLTPWPGGTATPRAGVSSFGFGGTNAHVVLQAPPPAPPVENAAGESAIILPLSARSPQALRRLATEFRARVDQGGSLSRQCRTAAIRRSHLDVRLAVAGRTVDDIRSGLDAYLEGQPWPGLTVGRAHGRRSRGPVLIFSGHGSQWPRMASDLVRREPVVADTLARCDEALRRYLDWSLRDAIDSADSEWLDSIDLVQPALFAIQIALTSLLRSWGIEPAAVVGHSMGEVSAAHVAGSLGLDDAARVICHRSRLLQQLRGGGSMVAVELSCEQAQEAVAAFGADVAVAANNSPSSTVLAGDPVAIKKLVDHFERSGIGCRFVQVDVAAHSPQVEPLCADLCRALAGIAPAPPAIPFYSTVTGALAQDIELGPAYWARNLREQVRFTEAITAMLAADYRDFLEISPHPILLGPVQQCLEKLGGDGRVSASLRRDEEPRGRMLSALGALYASGSDPDWRKVYAGPFRPVALPSYPWQQERYWFDAPKTAQTEHAAPAAHRLLQRRLPTATPTWEIAVDASSFPHAGDHRVGGNVVLPFAVYVEMAVAAASEALGGGVYDLTDVSVPAACNADPSDRPPVLQAVLSPAADNDASFSVYSRSADGDSISGPWMLHMKARLRGRHVAPVALPDDDFEAQRVATRCGTRLSAEECYSRLAAHGAEYGPSFRAVSELWLGNDEALASLQEPPATVALASARIHPALLDACGQVLMALAPASTDVAWPISAESIEFGVEPTPQAWAYVRLRDDAPWDQELLGDAWLLTDDGRVVVAVGGLRFIMRDEAPSAPPDFTGWLYQMQWQPAPLPDAGSLVRGVATYLILTDRSGIGNELVSVFSSHGQRCMLVRWGQEYRSAPDGTTIRPGELEDMSRLLREISAWPPLGGVVHLWSLDVPQPHLDVGGLAQALQFDSVVHLVQAATARSETAFGLWLVTRGVHGVMDGRPCAPEQAPIWGLGRTVAYEYPRLRCVNVDLAAAADANDANALAREVLGVDDEDHVCLSGGRRSVARLTRDKQLEQAALEHDLISSPAVPFRACVVNPGVVDSVRLCPASRRLIGRREVEIEVRAVGLNFRDVMKTLGLDPTSRGSQIPLGNECAGRVVTVGADVSDFAPGDEVMAVAEGCFRTFAVAAAEHVVRKPPALTPEDAASLPVAFLTAYYALCRVAGLCRGERALIHAAAGGVGLAAVQIAQHVGAEVFATAGTPAKRAFLRSMGVQHVDDSRSLTFARTIRVATNGRGVDVVLNSLGADVRRCSLSALAAGGRFLEIGKRDLHANETLDLGAFRKNLAFFSIDLFGLFHARPEAYTELFREVMPLIVDGSLRRLPVTVFALQESVQALRYMAEAKHTGKVVITVSPAIADASAVCRPEATYLITGGTRGLGLAVAEWLAAEGARHLALIGRHAVDGDAASRIERLGRTAQVELFSCDVADRESLQRSLDAIARSMPPLAGVFHAAAVVSNCPLGDLDPARVREVMVPKVRGSWNLHRLTAGQALDHFVLFSTAASLLGSPGQGHYAAANAFLDALAHYRRSCGLPALSVNWGPWARVGYTATDEGRRLAGRMARGGIGCIPLEDGLAIAGALLRSDVTQVGVVPAAWDRWRAAFPSAPRWLTRSDLGEVNAPAQDESTATRPIHTTLIAASHAARHELIAAYCREQVAGVLGSPPAKLDWDRPLTRLGLDSLMVIQFRNRVQTDLGVTLSLAYLLKGPELAELAGIVEQQWNERITATGSSLRSTEGPAVTAELATWVNELPDGDVDRLLTEMLAEEGGAQ